MAATPATEFAPTLIPLAPTVALPTPIATAPVAGSGITPGAPTPAEASLFPPVSANEWQTGPADAAVTFIEYSDFQCPYCAELAATLQRIRAEYPQDFRLVYRHFPLVYIGDKAVLAAEAAEAAGAQGRFWEMHDLLYANNSAWFDLSEADFNAKLDEYAASLNLDLTEFGAALDAHTYRVKVLTDYNSAASIPLPGAPFLLFNGVPYQGPVNHWALVSLIKLEKLKRRQFAAPEEVIDPLRQYAATLRTTQGDVVIELYAEQVPLAVNSFVFLAQNKWFDGNAFYRVVPGQIVEAGDPTDTGLGGPGYYLPLEINSRVKFDAAGRVGLDNSGPDTNGSRFFIALGPSPARDGQYTLIGMVTQGLDVLTRLAPRDPATNPEAAPGDQIISVTIEEE